MNLALVTRQKTCKNRMKGLSLTWAACLCLRKQFLQEKWKCMWRALWMKARAYRKYRFLKKSIWALSYLGTVGCQSLSDSWLNNCPFSKYNLQIGILVRSHAPVCLSVSKKEKGASLSDIALLHSCNGLWVAWVCLPCRSIRTGKTEVHSSTASVFTGFMIFSVILIANESFLHFLSCIFASLLPFFSVPLSPLSSSLFLTFPLSSYYVLTPFSLFLVFFQETLLISKTFCLSISLQLTSFWNFYIFPWKY